MKSTTADRLREHAAHVRRITEQIAEDRRRGTDVLPDLLAIAQGSSGQSAKVARFLLGLYNGQRFPFDLTNLRGLDYAIMEQCLAVLRMDANAYQEVHLYFENGGRIFEQLAEDYGMNKP